MNRLRTLTALTTVVLLVVSRRKEMGFMKQVAGAAALGTGLLIGFGLSASPAQAGYIVTLDQVGSNVVATGSGTLDTAALTFVGTPSGVFGVIPSVGQLITAPGFGIGSTPEYSGVGGPTSFGSGGLTPFTAGSGNTVGIAGMAKDLFVPVGYISGNPLSDTATYDGRTLASLGVTPGTYVWTWGSGATADSFTLQIGPPTAVPEPSSLLLFGGALAGLKLVRARRHTRRVG